MKGGFLIVEATDIGGFLEGVVQEISRQVGYPVAVCIANDQTPSALACGTGTLNQMARMVRALLRTATALDPDFPADKDCPACLASRAAMIEALKLLDDLPGGCTQQPGEIQ